MANRINHEKLNRQSKVYSRGYSSVKNKEEVKFIKMTAKFNTKCLTCGKPIQINKKIKYFPEIKSATHINCKNPI